MSDDRAPLQVLAFAGSLRQHSYNRQLVRAAAAVVPAGLVLTVHDSIADIPLFDEDLEAASGGGPEGVKRLRAAVAAADGVLIATPEYNQSLPGVLKNTLDWLSRDDAEHGAVLAGKPVAIMGATPGRWGTRLAQSQLRHALAAIGALTLTSPQLYVAEASAAFDAGTGSFDAGTQKRLHGLLAGLQTWMQVLRGDGPA